MVYKSRHRKVKRGIFLTAPALLGLIGLCIAQTFANSPAHEDTSISAFAQRSDLDQKVAHAIELAKKKDVNDISTVYSLCKENGVSILPYFHRYISDKNSDVRYAVEDAASEFNNPLAEAMLLQLVRDNDTYIADDALRTFIRTFPLKELSEADVENLNDGLTLRAKRGDASGLSLLLLSDYAQTPDTIALLNRLRQEKSDKIDMISALPAERSTIVDATLAQLNDKPASQRISQVIHSGSVASDVDVIVSIPYMKSTRLLLQTTELLKDTRITERVRGGMGFCAPGTTVPSVMYHRVCDLALITFAIRNPTVIHVDINKGNQRSFTQDELNDSYNALTAYYNSL